MPSEIPPTEFEDLLVMLTKGGVAFLVVGGIAVSLNGFDRVTKDVDVLVDHSRPNLERLLEVLAGFGEGHARELKPDDFVCQEGSIRIGEHFDLDIFVQMAGLKYEDMLKDSQQTTLGGETIRYLSPSQLIFLKKGSYREKDQLDVHALSAILRERGLPVAGPSLIDKLKIRLGRWLRT